MRKLIILVCGLLLNIGANADNIIWHDPMQADEPYLNGRGWNKETEGYNRFPNRFEKGLSKAVWNLSHDTPGMSVKFTTNATTIYVRYLTYFDSKSLPNVVSLSHSGVDLFAYDVDGNERWVPNNMKYTFSLNKSDTVQFTYNNITIPSFSHRGMEYELYLPTYNGIKWMSIGVEEGKDFQFIRGSQEKPIVVYGTSIAHGASASRPGLIWSTLLKRRFDIPFINLGFSGSAKMEHEVYDALSELDARMFILDCVPNCGGLTEEVFAERLRYGIHKLRSTSKAPIVLCESNTILGGAIIVNSRKEQSMLKDSLQYAVYKQLVKEGVKDLYYISLKDLAFAPEDFIEGVHPTDLGMRKYEAAYSKIIQEVLIGEDTMQCFKPIRQRRDRSYEWTQRHNEMIKLNNTTSPEVLMIGNSITHFWGGEPLSNRNNGGNTWKNLFGKHRVVNMGMGWDRVENVYWRLTHGEIEGCSPKEICLMIGTNNLADSNEKIVSGICDIVKYLRKYQPQAMLHVVKIYPRAKQEERVKAINELLEKTLVADEKINIVDPGQCLSLADGKIDPSNFVEGKNGLHPNEKGYKLLSKEYKKFLFKK